LRELVTAGREHFGERQNKQVSKEGPANSESEGVSTLQG